MKLWLQKGSIIYKAIIPQDCEDVSDLITLIRTNAVIKDQLQIHDNSGTIKLLRSNGTVLDMRLPLENLSMEEGYINDGYHPIIVLIQTSRETSNVGLFEQGIGYLIALEHTKKQKLNPPEWKQENPFIYSIEMGKMVFVNRSLAIEQLHEIHKAKYARASSSGEGKDWIIPIADNVIGLGKTAFGRHYIRKSRELWKDVENKTDFQKTLSACHTVHITFHAGALLEGSFDSVMLKFLRDALEPMFDHNIPVVISNPPETVIEFLKELTKCCGPIFIVLDEIGDAFEHGGLTDIEKREKFMWFCKSIVGTWLSLENVFFLLLGRGSFLSYVGLGPLDVKLTQTGFKFQRLGIHLLRTNSIEEIVKSTRIFENHEKTIQEHLGLNEQQCSEVAAALFRKTNGHPRTLLHAFATCQSYIELMNFNQPVDISDWKLFYNGLFLNKSVIIELLEHMENDAEVNLTQTFTDSGEKTVTYDIIASNSFISWEGTVLNARLYTHPFVKNILENFLLPFKEYVEYVGNVSRVSVDYPTVFEWMFLKRFQELFSAAQQPSKIHPLFFDTPVFGSLCQLSFSSVTRQIPKITNNGIRHAKLDSETAHPEAWQTLMAQIDKLSDICLKPRAKSASTDALLISRAKFKKDSIKVTVGLAVKNFRSTEFTLKHLERECHVFNRIFEGTDCLRRRNILFICCTKYHKDILSRFHGKLWHVCHLADFNNIHEIVLLDLTTAQNRISFFDVKGNISECVENVVAKSEVEFDDQN